MVTYWTRAVIWWGAVSWKSEASSPEKWENSEATNRNREQRRRGHWEERY